MELKIIGEHFHKAVIEGIMPPATKEGICARRLYETTILKTQHTNFNGKTFIEMGNGVLIIPDDNSYTQFINNTWYEGDNFSAGNAI